VDNSVGDRGACLACEAVVNKGYRAVVPLFIQRSISRFLALQTDTQRAQQDPFGLASEARSTGGDPFGLASEARSTGGDPSASQARQRSTGGDLFAAREERALAGHGPETRGNIEALRHLKLLEDSHAYH
jgi:hypothetical protein